MNLTEQSQWEKRKSKLLRELIVMSLITVLQSVAAVRFCVVIFSLLFKRGGSEANKMTILGDLGFILWVVVLGSAFMLGPLISMSVKFGKMLERRDDFEWNLSGTNLERRVDQFVKKHEKPWMLWAFAIPVTLLYLVVILFARSILN